MSEPAAQIPFGQGKLRQFPVNTQENRLYWLKAGKNLWKIDVFC
jgi:hypothetical protein